MVAPDILAHLDTQFRRAQAILFTGAGFSSRARNTVGEPLPTAADLRPVLWRLCFPDDAIDPSSSIQDLFEYALTRNRNALTELLRQTLTADAIALPPEYSIWFSMPWHRVYTLNIDDVPSATSRQFTLPRSLRIISATTLKEGPRRNPNELDIVHLNGTLEDVPDGVTFSTTQYAERLARQEPWYGRCLADVLTHPVIFVGTRLDEPPLWQHLEFRKPRGGRGLRELRAKSYLVLPHLDRARKELLREFNIVHIPMTMEEFTARVLSRLNDAAQEGRSTIDRIHRMAAGIRIPARIPDVADLAKVDPLVSTEYLLGQEPTWADLHAGRAIRREVDERLQAFVHQVLAQSGPKGILLVSGTAGSGKSTSLMRIALSLSAEGRRVGWIDRDTDLSPRDIRLAMERDDHPQVLFMDDADVYGPEVANLAREIALARGDPFIVMATRSAKADRIADPIRQMRLPFREEVIPHLTDADIGGLIDVLDRENRLGILKGKPRAFQERAFREHASRQLLVAMLQATSDRRFEERIVDEMGDLDGGAREVYSLFAVATTLRHFLARDEILLAIRDGSNATLNTVDTLVRRRLIVPAAGGAGLALRHRVIAEVVFEEMCKDGTAGAAIARLVFMAASKVSPVLSRGTRPWRLLKMLINHEFLLRVIGPENGRDVYTGVEGLLHWEYHYWLQRGSLELEAGDIRRAENFLNQAHSLGPDDPLVRTEYGYLLIRLGVESPVAPDAALRVAEGFSILEEMIKLRGLVDPYAYHIMGSQGLAWCRRASLGWRDRKDLLERLIRIVDEGRRSHPKAQELQQLHTDLQRELMMMAVEYKETDSTS